MSKQDATTNGNGKPEAVKPQYEYVEVDVVGQVMCKSCNIMAAPQGVQWADNEDSLLVTAENMHAQAVTQAKQICFTPKLIVLVGRAFIKKELLD